MLNDNEIIKALESEVKSAEYVDNYYCNGVDLTLIKSAIDLINCQQVEIKRLRKEVNLVSIQFQDMQERYEEAQTEVEQWKEEANKYQKLWCIAIDDIEAAKSEIYKEFAEHLKERWSNNYYDSPGVDFYEFVDNILKEMEDED